MSSAEICLVVAHDAGGAEILASYIVQNKLLCRFVLAGPALKVFQRKLGSFALCGLEQGLLESTWCLCGTSWQSDLEWQAIQQAKDNGMRVVAFIDHWVNYPERFMRNSVQHLPNEVWVGDNYAEKIAKQHFPNTRVMIVDNPYLKDIELEITALKKTLISQPKNEKSVLFVSENLSGHALLKYGDRNYFGYTEFDALELLLNNLECVDKNIKTLVIRPHPSDQPNKYDAFLVQYPDLIKISRGTTLVADIVATDVVAGCESMALLVGVLANKKVFSCITTNNPCRLPHKEILMLKNKVLKLA
ncbi:MAG: hypothetical protein methR_P0383 [Methyloprofundus sp.]|nr:MAG: hypothetical protein methR_P0383 [Methyloprofundus sp.]